MNAASIRRRAVGWDRSRLLGPWRSWTGVLCALGLAYVAVYLMAYVSQAGGTAGAQLLSDFGEEPVEALGVLLALVVIQRETRARARVAWGLIALGLAANLIGNVVYGAYDLAGEQPFPSIADAFYLSFYVCMFAGLLAYPTASGRREALQWRVWSNVAIVVIGGGMALLHFVLLPTVQDLGSDPLGMVISLAYPAGDLALLTALATIATRRPFAGDRRALAGFMVAVAAWFFADLAFAIEGSSYAAGSPSDLVWLVGDVAFLLAAQGHLLSLPRADAHRASAPLSIGRIGPYVMLAAGLLTLVSAAVATQAEVAGLAGLAVFLTALVVVRQLMDEQERRAAEAALLAEQASAAAQAAVQARHDVLTGLPNRMRLGELLAAELEASRLTGRPVTLAFLDLNEFKAVNDTLGHAAGDHLLVEVARRLEGSARAGDTVVRLGGDEFAIVLPGATEAQALAATGRLMRDLERPVEIAGTPVSVSGAVGLATFPDSGAVDDDALMHQADTAMYRAKRGHLGPTPYEAAFEDHLNGASLRAELREAIAGEGLRLEYQPIRERATGSIMGVEALVRWQHPTRGLLQPADFVPLAAQSGLIRDLDARVLELAATQAAAWRAAGVALEMSINLSPASLADPAWVDRVAASLEAHRLPGRALIFEVTEEGLVDRPEAAPRFVSQMRALGVRLAIDDFGTGFSSLSRLRDLRVDYLKIDRRFVSDALREPDDAAIVEAVVALGHRLGMRVTAEGVEDEATLRYLDALEVDFAQGFFLGRPQPPQALLRMLTRTSAAAPAGHEPSGHVKVEPVPGSAT